MLSGPGPGRRRCGVLGRPIAHSLSPALHRAAYAALGLDWEYDAHDVGEDDLAAYLEGLDDSWHGLSLTMPLKRAVMPLLDEVSDTARLAGGANTVVLEGGRRVGDNTDVPGVVGALRERLGGSPDSAIVLGGGATAASVLLGLADLGCSHATLLVRDPARAVATVEAVHRHPTPPLLTVARLDDLERRVVDADLLVSTIPAEAQTSGVLSAAAQVGAVFEVVYDPWPTPLAETTLSVGLPLVDGLDLLAHQAALQVALMTGQRVEVGVLREAGRAELARRADSRR
ncbi:shikimate dehydrogenase [Nocardioides marmoribigeumensis]|uniref:shikimate dehydrogenase n=1 Tax=Nocardioides marmoribigeumensis TaxID=433649 RepID=UPI0033719B03